jgi:hypothetical protein
VIIKRSIFFFVFIAGLVIIARAQRAYPSTSIYVVNSYTKLPYARDTPNREYFRHYNYKHSLILEGTRNGKYVDLVGMLGYTFVRGEFFQLGLAGKFYILSFLNVKSKRNRVEPYLRGEYQFFIKDNKIYRRRIFRHTYPHKYRVLSVGAGMHCELNERYSINVEGMLFGFNDFRIGIGRRF